MMAKMTVEQALDRARAVELSGDLRVFLTGMKNAARVLATEVERLRGAKQELIDAVDILVERSSADNLNALQRLVRVRDAIERAFAKTS